MPLPSLKRRLFPKSENAQDFRTLAAFPWDTHSLEKLWDGRKNNETNRTAWKKMLYEWSDTVAVGSNTDVHVLFTLSKRCPIRITLPKDLPEYTIPADKTCVAFTITHSGDTGLQEPLLIISRGGLLYIWNLERNAMSSYLRGHGGAITSIAVHPTIPELFCTTSRDHSTRVYNLILPPVQRPKNPHWPPAGPTTESRAGPAHGLHMNQLEGKGWGRCIIVLMGGRSGGHNAAVLGAAFHPNLPVIATCGMDRAVKIWHIQTDGDGKQIIREDKPLFSSTRLHRARVLSVSWLSDDILLTHSAPAIMRKDVDDADSTYLEPGEYVVWRWLGMNRFFPMDMQHITQHVLRGTCADYLESSSFKFITVYRYDEVPDQYTVPNLSLFQSDTHDPTSISTYPGSSRFMVTSIPSLKPRRMLTFDEAFPDIAAVAEARRAKKLARAKKRMEMRTTTHGSTANPREEGANVDALESDEEEESEDGDDSAPLKLTCNTFEPEQLSKASWIVDLPPGETANINCAVMSCGGRLIVGAGSRGTLWVWQVPDPS